MCYNLKSERIVSIDKSEQEIFNNRPTISYTWRFCFAIFIILHILKSSHDTWLNLIHMLQARVVHFVNSELTTHAI